MSIVGRKLLYGNGKLLASEIVRIVNIEIHQIKLLLHPYLPLANV